MRPRLRPGRLTEIPDSKVGQLLSVLDRSGLPQRLEELLDGRPGPPGVRPRTVLAGLMLAVYYTGRATVAEAWRILHFRLRPTARVWLGIPQAPPGSARECVAASRRLYRGLDRITTVLDPARCDRRRRLPQADADAHAAAWDTPAGRQAAGRLQKLANDLVLTPVRIAQQRGHLRGWRGDIGVDATAIPVLAKPDSEFSGTASVEITAGLHFSGGSDEGVFGYSATFLVAAHTRPAHVTGTTPAKTTAYPQLCLGLVLDTPTVRTGPNAITLLRQLDELQLPKGTCAADRAYTGCSPQHFQVPARRLGYRLALDYKVKERGLQGTWQGALLVDGSLACPRMPTALVEATHGADDKAVRIRSDELKEAIAQRRPYFLKLKESADARGTVRLQCPAAGPSPSVNCPRRNRLRPNQPRSSGPPPTVVNLADTRSRAAHPAARPTVQLPDNEWLDLPPQEDLPAVCGASAISVPADARGDLKTAKYRQDTHYLSPTWDHTYKPIRSHNEGINGRLKSGDMDIGNPKHRPAPGQVTQTLLIAIMTTIGNLDILETWLYQHTGATLDNDTGLSREPHGTPGPDHPAAQPPGNTGRPPPRVT
ncbi:hypothetical protein AC230_00815 [Streptomyces caatingaensis]|uniref:Uncharacterized protein n=1 Tax=Streptomyces caatingaensis TaxID=1678637 RepID=A0A0K9XM02_9ACTN|nr:hypothetical protein AC230_26850 [Streptomyces caatingaensis]KNB50954.1 hypothetical protein AC230_19115 [Streptomyces caatingaensis]KNB52501.1 hypothetical protein AC230_11150 [Streptomyces caatingaensis]KNB54464.1 hypothetical protein AC230_00815 [Streptomyces caatingaensis]